MWYNHCRIWYVRPTKVPEDGCLTPSPLLTSSSHLVTIQPGPMLSDALASSPILRAEDGTALAPVGTGFEFGIDPSEDPELAMVSHHLEMGRAGPSTLTTHQEGLDIAVFLVLTGCRLC